MKKLLILFMGLLLFALLGYLCIYKYHANEIQNDIDERANAALLSENFTSVTVAVDGRDITLTGMVATEEQKTRAEELAKVRGFHLFTNQLVVDGAATEIPPPPVEVEKKPQLEAKPVKAKSERPYEFMAILSGSKEILLEGSVPDAEAHQKILSFANKKYGPDRVSDMLKLRPDAPAGWQLSAQTALTHLGLLKSGKAELAGQMVTITGVGASEEVLQKIKEGIVGELPEGYQSTFQLSVPGADSVKKPDDPGKGQENQADQNNKQTTGISANNASAISCQQRFSDLLSAKKIHFKSGSAAIAPNSRKLLDELAVIAQSCPAQKIRIEGHTDSSGSAKINQKLSQARAQFVVDYLVKKGIEKSRLSAVGHGENKPVASNATKSGMALNRRIEFTIEGIK
jgi:OOP family OmpA-OmpF porin